MGSDSAFGEPHYAVTPLSEARREAETAMGEYKTRCPMGVRSGSRLYGALRAAVRGEGKEVPRG